MTRFLKRLWPRSVYGQIVVIIVSGLLATFAMVAVLFMLLRPKVPPLPPGPWPNALAIVASIEAVRTASPDERDNIARAVSASDMQIQIGVPPRCARIPPGMVTKALQGILEIQLGDKAGPMDAFNCAIDANEATSTRIIFPLDGISVFARNFANMHLPQVVQATLPVTVLLASLLMMIAALSLWSLWRINRPLRDLASSVEAFSYDIMPAPLPEQGPTELRFVARAFNRMQARIAVSAEERTRMLMAIGHDLRTPLTRLVIRVEMDGQDADPSAMGRDLDLMTKMLNGALSFLNGRGDGEVDEPVDLGALVESLCAELNSVGKDVTYRGIFGTICVCQPTAISCAITNLVENGCKYGTRVLADVWEENDHAIIEVRDDGPGIPSEMRDIVLLPFVRLDPARSAEGSLGLGLSIVQDVARRHGGTLTLLDAEPTGLLVRIAPASDTKTATPKGKIRGPIAV